MTNSIEHLARISRSGARRIVVTEDGTLKEGKLSRWDRFRNATIGPSERDREINKLAHASFLNAINRATGGDEDAIRAYNDILRPVAEAGKPLSARMVKHVLEQLQLTESDLYLRNYTNAQRYLKSDAGKQAFQEVYNKVKKADPDFKKVYTFEQFVESASFKLAKKDDAGLRLLTEADFRKRLDAWPRDYFRQANSAAMMRLAEVVKEQNANLPNVGKVSFPEKVVELASADPNFDKRRLSKDELQPYLQQGIDIKLWPSLKKSPGEGLTVVDVRKEEFGQLLDEYAASWDLEARPTKNNNERRSNARNVLARNAAAIPGYRRLVKFTIIPLADLSLKTINPQEAFKTLQKNKELGIELSNEDVAALVEAPNLGISYQTAEAGEKKAIIGRIERVQKRLNKLNLKLEPAKDRPIVQALRDDIEDILGEIDNVLEGERAAPSARHAGKRRERRKVTFANPVTTVPDPKPPQDKASSSSSFG